MAAQGQHSPAQGMHSDAQGLHSAAQGLHSTAQGLHSAAQNLHIATQRLQMHNIAVYAAYGCWLAGHRDPPWSTVQRQVVVNRMILGPQTA